MKENNESGREEPVLLVVLAHPDDESICSGVMARAVARGGRVVLACATRGEAGEIADASLATPQNLGAVREQELRCACSRLGIAEPRLLGYCDSGMAGTAQNDLPTSFIQADAQAVRRQIVTLMRELRPQSVITFEPYGIYGHPDHIAVSRYTTEAFDLAGDAEAFPESGRPWRPQYLYYGALSESWFEQILERTALLGLNSSQLLEMSPEMQENMQAITAQITHEIDVSAYLPQKLSALSCHQTQLTEHSPFYHLIKPELSDMFSPEYFVEVRQPERTEGSGEESLLN